MEKNTKHVYNTRMGGFIQINKHAQKTKINQANMGPVYGQYYKLF